MSGGEAEQQPKAIILDKADTVAVVLRAVSAGEEISMPGHKTVIAQSDLPRFHKIALRHVAVGEDIIKFGQIIGVAATKITIGDHVHIHNLRSRRATNTSQE